MFASPAVQAAVSAVSGAAAVVAPAASPSPSSFLHAAALIDADPAASWSDLLLALTGAPSRAAPLLAAMAQAREQARARARDLRKQHQNDTPDALWIHNLVDLTREVVDITHDE